MQIHSNTNENNMPCCVALGFFDGVHTGHRKILLSMKEYAEEHELCPCVFTFAQSPCSVLGKAESRALQTYHQRMDRIAEYSGAQVCYAVDFMEYRDMLAEDFVKRILLEELDARAIFCGFNFRFGKGAMGDTALLQKICGDHNVRVFVSEPVCTSGEAVSSTNIRKLIAQGKMLKANSMLAAPFTIEGYVLHGLENGRKVGIPTINIGLPEDFVIPRLGAYASFAFLNGKRYRAVTNVGVRPTVSGKGVNCETHILDELDGELYGKTVSVQLLWFERDERRFDSLPLLAQQIERDIDHIHELNIYDLYISGEYRNGCNAIR